MSAKLEENTGELQELRLSTKDYGKPIEKSFQRLTLILLTTCFCAERRIHTLNQCTRSRSSPDRIDTEAARWYIFGKTAMMPAIYDHGTYSVTDQKLSLEALKEISDSDDVIELTGEYSGSFSSTGPMHECHV